MFLVRAALNRAMFLKVNDILSMTFKPWFEAEYSALGQNSIYFVARITSDVMNVVMLDALHHA